MFSVMNCSGVFQGTSSSIQNLDPEYILVGSLMLNLSSEKLVKVFFVSSSISTFLTQFLFPYKTAYSETKLTSHLGVLS